MKQFSIFFLLFFLLGNTPVMLAQTEPEDINLDENKFQDFFYESLKQKAIENYDKSIIALENCLKLEPKNATVHFELGKNHLALKEYQKAYTYFEQATIINPDNKWFWVGLYDVDYATKDYQDAIKIVNKLILFDPKFKEDLTSLYMSTGQFDQALELINELNESVGKTDRRESYKLQILSQGKYQNAEITNLIDQIAKSPKVESNYIALIYLYSKNNEVEKVLETAQKLEREIPTSEWAQVSLFKHYVENNESEKAVNAMNIVLSSSKIDSKIKHRILNEFLIYAQDEPELTPNLDKAISYFDNDPEVNVAKEVGKFYHNKKQWEKAVKYYELAIKKSAETDIELNILLLESYTQIKKFDLMAKKAAEMMEYFPAQPHFYYYSGLALNQSGQYRKAIEILETGIDYVLEDLVLEINFNIQLGEAYNGIGDNKKRDFFFSKADKLLKQKN